MKKATKKIESHLWGTVKAMTSQVSSGPSESMNSRIKTTKVRASRFRNKERFIHAIYIYLRGLDLYPEYVWKRVLHQK